MVNHIAHFHSFYRNRIIDSNFIPPEPTNLGGKWTIFEKTGLFIKFYRLRKLDRSGEFITRPMVDFIKIDFDLKVTLLIEDWEIPSEAYYHLLDNYHIATDQHIENIFAFNFSSYILKQEEDS